MTLLAAALAGAIALAGEGWQTDWQAAKDAAAKDGRDILVDFTGSDWCGWCIRLDKEVFSQEAFTTYAAASLVLMEVDFPRKKELPPELKAQNQALQEQFGVTGFPSLFLTDAQGCPFGRTGYKAGGADAYVAHLKELVQVREQRDQAFEKAKQAQGLERAKLLAQGLEPIPASLLGFYEATVREIRELDPDDQAGFKAKLAEMELGGLEDRVRSLCRDGKQDEAIAAVDTFIGDHGATGELKQKALMAKLNACPPQTQEGLTAADALMDEVIAVDAASPTAKQCTAIKARIVEMRKQLGAKETAAPAAK
jgi:thiol-disulfide isomerase/thioredoxin